MFLSRWCHDLPGKRRAKHERCKGKCNYGFGLINCECGCHHA